MVTGNYNLFDFQEKAVIKLIDLVSDENSKQVITIKSPTGSGKTVMLIGFIDEYLSKINPNASFIWLCPGKGDLEEQSRKKMLHFAPHIKAQTLFDALSSGFSAGSATFINWELVTKSGNTSLRDGERKNLFDRIAEAHRDAREFIVIIDEEHSNNTAKAKNIIDAFSAKNVIRVSATAVLNKRFEYFEIDELDVIAAGLITKALYVNEGITDGMEVGDDYDILLDLADNKRKAIAERYRDIGSNIRPLVLIQFPNGQPETVSAVEKKLETLGYTYANGMVAKWMSEDKRELSDNLTAPDGTPVFLLMKQAISTGWDCPRAKILVKLREGMSESFEIQTIGRIRRMPEARHYEDDLLDFCYVYTFDDKYKAGLLSNLDKAYETRRLFLKDKCKTFTLEKQTRDLDYGGLGEREVLYKLHDYLKEKYSLGRDRERNRALLSDGGYIFGSSVCGQALEGQFVRTTAVAESNSYRSIKKSVSTSRHGLFLLHGMDMIKSSVGMPTAKVKTVLERLFRDGGNTSKNLVLLNTREFYAFVINNSQKLKRDFREVTAKLSEQLNMVLAPKTVTFRIPEQDFYKYDPNVKDEREYKLNAYQDYTSGFATSLVRSTSEMLFERYLEKRGDIDWVYKNGDSGLRYFSVVYIDGLGKQWLFYPDYIVKKLDGSVFIIETKGGEAKGKDKNIDIQAENKFCAFKAYAEKYDVGWGFVRDKDGELYVNNTAWADELSNESWKPLGEIL